MSSARLCLVCSRELQPSAVVQRHMRLHHDAAVGLTVEERTRALARPLLGAAVWQVGFCTVPCAVTFWLGHPPANRPNPTELREKH